MIFSRRTKTSVGGCGGPDEKAGPRSLLKAEHKAGVAGKVASRAFPEKEEGETMPEAHLAQWQKRTTPGFC